MREKLFLLGHGRKDKYSAAIAAVRRSPSKQKELAAKMLEQGIDPEKLQDWIKFITQILQLILAIAS